MGDPSFDYASCIRQTSDGGYIVSGGVYSAFDSYYDGFLAKLYPDLIDVPEDGNNLPDGITLLQNYPNPFNARTQISFSTSSPGMVRLEIYDIAGRVIATPVDQYLPAGSHMCNWPGTNSQGEEVASGIYFYRLSSDTNTVTRKMTLLK